MKNLNKDRVNEYRLKTECGPAYAEGYVQSVCTSHRQFLAERHHFWTEMRDIFEDNNTEFCLQKRAHYQQRVDATVREDHYYRLYDC